MHPTEGSIFVTVGTTSFDALIAMVDSEPFARLLQMMGYGTLVVQYGELGSPT
jgi:UDP-N-acetylglucosamine transferase subunit ALG13